ncbi:MAG: response regulator [Candidatus Omnitrophota bacterium]|jgi:DNA-binding response OmpR family regulator
MSENKKILIIEDDVETQASLKMIFEEQNLIVITADDGEIGVKVAETEKPDLILMDVVMSKMNGYSCLKEIRKNSKIKDTPVLILSGKEKDKLEDLFAFHKISGYFEKPYKIDNLVAKVKEILKI